MPKPDSVKYEGKDRYEVAASISTGIEATQTKDGNNLIIISGDDLKAWHIKDERRFPKKYYIPGTEIAIAVLDNSKLVGIALGHIDTGNSTNGSVIVDRILHNDDQISDLRNNKTKIKVAIIDSKIKQEDAENLNLKMLMDTALEPGSKKITAAADTLQKLKMVGATLPQSPPKVVAAAKRADRYLS